MSPEGAGSHCLVLSGSCTVLALLSDSGLLNSLGHYTSSLSCKTWVKVICKCKPWVQLCFTSGWQLQVKKILFITQRSFPLGYQFLNTGQEKSMLLRKFWAHKCFRSILLYRPKMFLLIVQFDVIGLLIFLKVQEMPNRKVHIFHFKIKSQIHLVRVSQLFSM